MPPDLYLDYSFEHPDPQALVSAGVRGVLVYSRVSTPDRSYFEDCVGRGVSVNPIFETAGERANAGYQAGRDDGQAAAGDLDRIGIPDGVRLYVNMADTPNSQGFLTAIRDYATGFAEVFPARWQLGQYGNLAALRAAQAGSPRFDKLWAVETWYPGASGSVQDHWGFWLGQPDVSHVQMANVAPPLAGTDTNWLIPGMVLDGWGGTAPTLQGFRYPLDGTFSPDKVNSPFGMRNGKMHWGIDLWAPMGVPCYAVADGDVFAVAHEQFGGNVVAVYFDHPPTPAAPKFGYMHLERAVVSAGQHVREGDLIGYCDNTGEGSTGSHLHFWIGDNANVGAIDPTPFLVAGPSRPIDYAELETTRRALQGGNAVMLIPNFLTNEISMFVNKDGDLIHNSRNVYGVPQVVNEVLARGCDRAVQPSGRVDGQHLIIMFAAADGDERRIVFLAEHGGWVTDPNGTEWKIGAKA